MNLTLIQIRRHASDDWRTVDAAVTEQAADTRCEDARYWHPGCEVRAHAGEVRFTAEPMERAARRPTVVV